VSVREGIGPLRRIGRDQLAGRVHVQVDPRIDAIIQTLPVRFENKRALSMRFAEDASIEEIVRNYISASTRCVPQTDAERSCAWTKASITRMGDTIQMRVESGTGHTHTKSNGPRNIALANDVAARFGLPGRTTSGQPQAAPADEPSCRCSRQ
jgi:hypothetical protein